MKIFKEEDEHPINDTLSLNLTIVHVSISIKLFSSDDIIMEVIYFK